MEIKALYDRIPRLVKIFLLRATIIFVAWQLLYHFVLDPTRFPDKILTNITCFSTSEMLSLFYNNVVAFYIHNIDLRFAAIRINGKVAIAIADPCNALEIYVLYVAFLFCFPGNLKRRLAFIMLGLPIIYIINTIRCVLIAWLNLYHPAWSDFSHHYVFTTAVYLIVFYIWVLYSKKGIGNAA